MASMKPKRTMTMNWDDLAGNTDDDPDEFYESNNRISSVVPLDYLPSSAGGPLPLDLMLSDEDDDDDDNQFEDTRMSFTVQPLRKPSFHPSPGAVAIHQTPPQPSMDNYGMWLDTPGSITERRKRLLQGMGINSNKDLSRLVTMRLSKKFSQNQNQNQNRYPPGPLTAMMNNPGPSPPNQAASQPPRVAPPVEGPLSLPRMATVRSEEENQSGGSGSTIVASSSIMSPTKPSMGTDIVLFRSRSDGDMDSESFLMKRRREEMIGKNVSKQRLVRSPSTMAPLSRMCRLTMHSMHMNRRDDMDGRFEEGGRGGEYQSNQQIGAFFLIKNLDTGNDFIVKEFDQDGMWNRLSDLQTGKQLTMDEFEKTVGFSPVVKELMRRQHVAKTHGLERKMSAAISKSFRYSKKRGASFLKNIKSSVSSSFNSEKDVGAVDHQQKGLPPIPPSKGITSSEWVKVRQQGKAYKEFTALRLSQEIQAHEGSIWTMKFNVTGTYLASAGEDKVIHVWEVQECEIATLMPQDEGESASPRPSDLKKGKSPSKRGGMIPDYVQLPETVFGLSEKPHCSFIGHLDDVLDISWSTSHLHLLSSSMDKTVRLWDLDTQSCLKLFAHNDYVTCIQFNPVDDNYFISGSLDAKIRIWHVPGCRVVDWVDFHEMVTAACYSPDGQSAVIGSHKGNCRTYSTSGGKLSQLNQFSIPIKNKKVAKITGFEFTPDVPSEVLVTSADSRIRIYEEQEIINKIVGFQNMSSQIAASYSPCGRHVVCASEDSHVFVWRREEPRYAAAGAAAAAKTKTVVHTRSFEQFSCKDVSVAIPWPGSTKFEAPVVSLHAKKTKPPTGAPSPAPDAAKKPPLPKKGGKDGGGGEEKAAVQGTEEGEEKEEGAELAKSPMKSGSMRQEAGVSPAWTPGWGWLDGGGGGTQDTVHATAWGMVIVTAGLGGEIKAYQNLGLPVRIGKQKNLFS